MDQFPHRLVCYLVLPPTRLSLFPSTTLFRSRAEAEQFRGPRRLLRHAGEVGGDGVGDICPGPILQRSTEHPSSAVDEQQPFMGTFESREHASLVERTT